MKAAGTLENGVLFGHDGHLFLAHGGHHVLDYVTGQKGVNRASFAKFQDNIFGRGRAASGVPYVHLILPDKQTVLRREFPIANAVSIGELFLQQCRAVEHLIYFPKDVLSKECQKPFQSADTHLTDHGYMTIAARVVERLTGKNQQANLYELLDRPSLEKMILGDLGKKLQPQISSLEKVCDVSWPVVTFRNDLGAGNDGIVDIHVSPQAKYSQRLLWFGDSFGRGVSRYLSFFFREVLFVRTRYFHPEIFSMCAPDLLVTENVERYLDRCDHDDNRPLFFMYPYLNGTEYAASYEFARAFSAQLSYPRETYRLWLDEVILGLGRR